MEKNNQPSTFSENFNQDPCQVCTYYSSSRPGAVNYLGCFTGEGAQYLCTQRTCHHDSFIFTSPIHNNYFDPLGGKQLRQELAE